MKVFVSYPSTRRTLAEKLKLALEAEAHEVFFDRDDLAAGEAFHQRIHDRITAADLFIFLLAPESVREGSYTLAELAIAQQQWPQPGGRVLPVMVAATPLADIPPYLSAVTLLQPRGEVVAETMTAVRRLAAGATPRWRRPAVAGATVVLVGAGLFAGYQWQQARQLEAAQQAKQQAQIKAATQFDCAGLSQPGQPDSAAAFAAFAALTEQAAQPGAPAAMRHALQDCAMQRLRVARAVQGQTTFAQAVAPFKPVLVQGLAAAASGRRAADLRAHLGWIDYLVWRDRRNPDADPGASYQRALQDDPVNAYAHAMWGHWLLLREPGRVDEALKHFEAAREGGRDAAFVLDLQLGAMLGNEALVPELLRLLSRLRGVAVLLTDGQKQRVWSQVYSRSYRAAERQRLLGALAPEDGLRTFLWLFPQATESQGQAWSVVRAQLLTHAGRGAQARTELLSLQAEWRAQKTTGSIVDEVNRLLAGR